MFNFFGRNIKYRKVVAVARKAAKIRNEPFIVFERGDNPGVFGKITQTAFNKHITTMPMIKLLICLPGGEVSQ